MEFPNHPRILLLIAVMLSSHHACADDVFTCTGTDGERVYQDTSCATGAAAPVGGDIQTHAGSATLSPVELQRVSRVLRERARKREADARARDRSIDAMVQRHIKKVAICEHAKERYRKALVKRRRHGHITDEVEKASRRMHEACSD